MPSQITPKWKPIPFPFPVAPEGAELFDPVICNERAVLVAGGPLALSVFQVFSQKRVWFTVKARVWITGFSVSASSLYVQDGPVLSGWDLTQGGCFAAINLVTKKSWAIPPDATPSTQPPADLYQLPAGSAELQSSLMAARMAPRSSDPNLLAAENDVLASATAAAASVVFSAPVIRSMQFDGQPGGQIFSLGLDGTGTAMDDALAHVGTFKYEAPLRAELALSEVLQPSGNVLCHLHYVTANGGIASLDAMKSSPAPVQKWNNVGTLDPAKVLPLRFQEGLLWGGGILGADFFATVPDPSQPLMLTVPAPPDGWRTYDISPADKLVLISNGKDSRLVSYDKSSKMRDRWRLRNSQTSCRTAFWTGAGLDGSAPTSRLSIEVDRTRPGQSDPYFRVLLANTVDAPKPSLATNYPPLAEPIYEGLLSAGTFPTLQQVRAIVCKPIVHQQTLYCVVSGSSASEPPVTTLVLAAYALAPEVPAILPKAQAKLAELEAMVQPLRLRLMRVDTTWFELDLTRTDGPYPLGNAQMKLALSSGDLMVNTNDQGIVELDAALKGQHASVNFESVSHWARHVDIYPTSLEPGRLNEVKIATANRRFGE